MAGRELSGRVALVTGAAKRIGRSIALALAREGADVVVNYRNSKQEAEEAAAEIVASGVRALVCRADVSKREEVAGMLKAVEHELGRLDILVNNAGTFARVPFGDITNEQWDSMLDANLKSQFVCCQEATALLRTSGRGRIVNISSLGGLLSWPSYTHYCVSKAGSIMLTRCLARALAPKILVNSVAPGTVQFPGEIPDEDFIRRAPLKRTGTGGDIAEAVLFLVKSDFITGQVLPVDGGRLLT